MKKRILCLFVLVLACVFAAPASGEGIRYEGPGFDTPEEALTCYVEGIKELDFEKILSAFAWETQASHYSVKKQIERARSFSVSMKPRIPSDHPFAVTANLESLRSLQVDNLYKSLEFLMMGEHYHNNMAVSLREDAEIAAFLDYFDDSRLDLLTGMTNVRFIAPEFVAGGVFLSEKNQEMFAKQTAVYCADEVRNIVALADLENGETFYCCPTIARYGDKWYVVSTSSYISMFLGIDPACQAFFCGKLDTMGF